MTLILLPNGYENKSTIITTNKDFDKWNEIFADELLSRAIIDRVIHHASYINHQRQKLSY